MQIGIDAGALTSDPFAQYGTASFTRELIRAFAQYGTHDYHAYTFSQATGYGHVSMIRLPRRGFFRIFLRASERAHPSDIFLGINQVFPATRARLFGFSHGVAALEHPEAYGDEEVKRQTNQIARLSTRSERIFTTSSRVTKSLRAYVPKTPIHTLPMGLPAVALQPHIPKEPYIATVAMNHPIKRIDMLVRLFKRLRSKQAIPPEYRLILIGPHERYHNPDQAIIATGALPSSEVALWLQKSELYVCVSQYESFHFPYLEAAQAGCVTLGLRENVIPELESVVEVASSVDALGKQIATFCNRNKPIRPIALSHLQKLFDWKKTVQTLERYM